MTQETADDHATSRSPSTVRNRAFHRLKGRQIKTYGPGLHPDGGGLYLQVQQPRPGRPDAPRSWLFLYTSPLTRKRVEMGLGRLGDVSLDGA